MFDEDQSSLTGSVGQPSLTGQDNQGGFLNQTGEIRPPVDLPETGQPAVRPKPGGTIPGTEDIFADTDETLEPQLRAVPQGAPKNLPPLGPPQPLTQLPDDEEDEKGGGGRKFLTIILVLIIIGGVGYGGYYAYNKYFANQDFDLPELNINSFNANKLNEEFEDDITNLNLDQNIEEETGSPNVNQEKYLDSDKDGLTDEEEKTYGTDLLEPDSDGDGLFDKEEVKIYKTNPLDPDTDADGYIDGDEVSSGYDPNGPGKLLDTNF